MKRRGLPRRATGGAIQIALVLVAASLTVAGSPPTPAPVEALLYSREFRLENAYSYDWSAGRPRVDRGRLVVLQVDPELVRPRQSAEPVLYVGSMPVHCLNTGYPSGRVVAIVPGKTDLTREPIFFGTPELPERVDEDSGQRERRAARAAGIEPCSGKRVSEAERLGGGVLRARDLTELLEHAATLMPVD